jgi:hypothetical protein
MSTTAPFIVKYASNQYKVLGVCPGTQGNTRVQIPHFVLAPEGNPGWNNGNIQYAPVDQCEFVEWVQGCVMCGAPKSNVEGE